MKSYILFSLLFLTALFHLQAQQVQNPGFEESFATSKSGVTHWKPYEKNAKVQMTTDNVQSGQQAMLIEGYGEGSFGSFSQIVDFQISEKGIYYLSGYMRTENVVNGNVGLRIIASSGKKTVFYEDMNRHKIGGNSNWKRYKISFLANPSMDKIEIGGRMSGEGRAWFDDFKITNAAESDEKTSAEAKKYLKKVFRYIKKHYVHKDEVELGKIREEAFQLAKGAETTYDCYPIVRNSLSKMKATQSYLVEPGKSNNIKMEGKVGNTLRIPQPSGRMIQKQYAYISLPFLTSGDEDRMIAFADSIQAVIKKLDTQSPKGWILDLRRNSGSNYWPMMAGIGPILGEGVCGYFINAKGKKTKWNYENGAAGAGARKNAKLSVPSYSVRNIQTPIAVLTSTRTSKAGEILTVAFKGKNNTKVFGEPTMGLTTLYRHFKLKDGSVLVLSTSKYADRTGKEYVKKIQPDVAVTIDRRKYLSDDDPVILEAIKWLGGM